MTIFTHICMQTARSLLERAGADATYAIQKKIIVSDVLQGLVSTERKRFENARWVSKKGKGRGDNDGR